jgi:hypothetical protein
MNISQAWTEFLQVVQQCDRGGIVDPGERQDAVRSALVLGNASVPNTVACSISQADSSGRFETPASDGPLAIALDRAQYDAGDGPCVSAARHRRLERIDVMADDDRWPELSHAALGQGVHSSLSLPLMAAPARTAALNFYGGIDGAYTPENVRARAGLLVRAVAILLSESTGQLDAVGPGQMQEVMAERALIDRAQRLIMARDGVDATVAYRRLAQRSVARQCPLSGIARQVLAHGDADADQDQDGSMSDDE